MLKNYFSKQSHIAPLVVFRIIFGLMMFGGVLRFPLKGWIKDVYIDPAYHFSYYGFEWVKPFGETGMYLVFGLMAMSAFLIAIGFLYRYSATLFFLSFTYVELIDKTTYLNHYYFISLVSFLMIWLPANRFFSVDAKLYPQIKRTHVFSWNIDIIKLQLGIVYFFAGIAKLNYDWLFRAMPLKIWLPANADLPLIGWLFDYEWTAFLFSWFGAIYDLTIPFLLLFSLTRKYAYFFVLVFHILTSLLFPIGMFPYIMVLATLIFFPISFHQNIISFLGKLFRVKENISEFLVSPPKQPRVYNKFLLHFLMIFFVVQAILPFRYLLYPGELFWTEQGYRFSWRVMLMEKAGTAFFYVKDAASKKESEVSNCDYLTPQQEKMMSTQPDMILQYAHFLANEFEKKGYKSPEVRVESYVTLNGSGSRLFVNQNTNLAQEPIGWHHKDWVLPFEYDTKTIAAK